MAKYGRNPFPYPLIKDEEGWSKPLALENFEYDWHLNVSPWDRLYYHNTLASMRQNRKLKSPFAPKDSLDIHLSSVYDQSYHSFPEKSDIYRQPDTVGLSFYRLHKNKRLIPDNRPARDLQLDEDFSNMSLAQNDSHLPNTKWHFVRHGGLKEKKSPFSVKLGLTGNHEPQSNSGYSRKIDGSPFAS